MEEITDRLNQFHTQSSLCDIKIYLDILTCIDDVLWSSTDLNTTVYVSSSNIS